MKAALASGSSTSYMYTHTECKHGTQTEIVPYILRLPMVHIDCECGGCTVVMPYRLTLPCGTREAMQMISRVAVPNTVFACIACSTGTAAVAC